MNEQAIELYKQAVAFAYNTAGADAGKGTVIESLTAGKFAELIVAECAEIALVDGQSTGNFDTFNKIQKHFGVEEWTM
jgi:hypothetical protein